MKVSALLTASRLKFFAVLISTLVSIFLWSGHIVKPFIMKQKVFWSNEINKDDRVRIVSAMNAIQPEWNSRLPLRAESIARRAERGGSYKNLAIIEKLPDGFKVVVIRRYCDGMGDVNYYYFDLGGKLKGLGMSFD